MIKIPQIPEINNNSKLSNSNSPIITIITVVRNNKYEIEETILSIVNQSYSNIEYIVIDGNSTDGTVEIINKYSNRISYFVSEPDLGIYDAMNKGIIQASGQWINFINSGDKYVDNRVLEDVSVELSNANKFDILYGNSFVLTKLNKLRHYESGNDPSKQWQGPIFRHGAMFVNAKLQKDFQYKLSSPYKICADFDFIYHMYSIGKTFKKINRDILIFSEGGISSGRVQCTNDNKMIVLNYTPNPYYKIWHNIWIIRAKLIDMVIFPFLANFKKLLKYNRS